MSAKKEWDQNVKHIRSGGSLIPNLNAILAADRVVKAARAWSKSYEEEATMDMNADQLSAWHKRFLDSSSKLWRAVEAFEKEKK